MTLQLNDEVYANMGTVFFQGWVVGFVRRRSGIQCYVIENDDEMVFIAEQSRVRSIHDVQTQDISPTRSRRSTWTPGQSSVQNSDFQDWD